ncbi:DUF2281 domain-containing protein [Fischerella thermalis CCMEE 5330]|uniref:DUF2281 domain-containing protein n=2 Tax=Nostocales TaxID=1161 RepID=A0A367QW13_9NOSO|nr:MULTISPECIES: DUF2281 domain-containing protein [Nostocales]MDZ8084316.1 DUF2281 domain-containing protein [Nostoc sp. DedQUE12b]PMB48670.1 DUF2281 domain-containing protein [Fischerella thermalis CCMEE 5330]RCJ28396.1 DUF2281 domain-containing protein [Nostoc minutum NIES-26]
MTIKEQITQELEKLPEPLLQEILDFVQFLQTKQQQRILSPEQPQLEQNPNDNSQTSYRPASGRSLLRHAGTWAGDDFEECLQSVYATRGKAKFDYESNPFE